MKSQRITYALAYARSAHSKQTRKYSKRPYFDAHIMPIYNILSDAFMPEDVIIAGILHDTVEDTKVEMMDIVDNFGTDVAKMVNHMTKVYDSNDSPEVKAQSEFDRWEANNNYYSKVIKIADVIANLSDDASTTPSSFKDKFKEGKRKLLPVLKIRHPLYKELVEILQ